MRYAPQTVAPGPSTVVLEIFNNTFYPILMICMKFVILDDAIGLASQCHKNDLLCNLYL